MNPPDRINLMETLPFFKAMKPDELENLVSAEDHLLTFNGGDRILQQGDIDIAFYILLDGKVSVNREHPTEVFLAQLVPGAIFGELTLSGSRPRNSSIRADENVTVFKVDQDLFGWVEPEVAGKIKDQIIQILVRRLDEMNNKLVSFVR